MRKSLTLTSLLLMLPVTALANSAYTDISTDDWVKPYLDQIISNHPKALSNQGAFNQYNPLTKAEAAKLILSVSNLDESKKFLVSKYNKADVQKGEWQYDTLESARYHKILSGQAYANKPNDLYYFPNKAVTRCEFAKMAVSAMCTENTVCDGTGNASDISVGQDNPFHKYVEVIYKTEGTNSKDFMCNTAIKRNEAIKILSKLEEGAKENKLKKAADATENQSELFTILAKKYYDITDEEKGKLYDLINNIEDPNITDENGETILMQLAKLYRYFAFDIGEERITPEYLAKILIDKGADVNMQNKDGINALSYAYGNYDKNMRLTKLLMENDAELNNQDKEGLTVLIKAIIDEDSEMTELLLQSDKDIGINIKAETGHTAIMWAVSRFSPALITKLINKGADVHAANDEGANALSIMMKTTTRVYSDVSQEAIEIAKILIAEGIDVNTSSGEYSPLMAALDDKKLLPLVDIFIENGADVNFKVEVVEGTEITPLAMIAGNGREELFFDFIEKGAEDQSVELLLAAFEGRNEKIITYATENVAVDPNQEINFIGKKGTILHFALVNKQGDYAKELIKNGADVTHKIITIGSQPQPTGSLFQQKVTIEEKPRGSYVTLAVNTDLELVKMLVEGGAEIRKETITQAFQKTEDIKIIEYLLTKKDTIPENAMQLAIANHNEELTELLIAKGHKIQKEHLFKAISENNSAFVKKAIEEGMDVNLTITDEGVSPLVYWAEDDCYFRCEESEEMLDTLLSLGAKIENVDMMVRTPLKAAIIAESTGYSRQTKTLLLLKRGADYTDHTEDLINLRNKEIKDFINGIIDLGQGYKNDNGTIAFKGTTLNGIDIESFKTIQPETYQAYAADKNNAYMQGEVMPNVDPNTLEIISSGGLYAKDKNNIYFIGDAIENADLESFTGSLNILFAKDKNNVYYKNHILSGADPNLLEEKIKDGIFYAEQLEDYSFRPDEEIVPLLIKAYNQE